MENWITFFYENGGMIFAALGVATATICGGIGSTIGVIIRFLICLLFINSQLALFVFGIANFVDFYCRSLVYRIVLSKLDKNKKLNTI